MCLGKGNTKSKVPEVGIILYIQGTARGLWGWNPDGEGDSTGKRDHREEWGDQTLSAIEGLGFHLIEIKGMILKSTSELFVVMQMT